MSAILKQIPRAEKREIATKVLANLQARAAQGPAEPALDAYIPELSDVETSLATHVSARTDADAKRTARLTKLEAFDDEVDRWYRHTESYVDVEGLRKVGPDAAAAGALHDAAFPEGLAYIDDPIADENRACREALTVLRSPEHAATVQAIDLPLTWLDRWELAVNESDAAYKDVEAARTDKQTSVSAGRDAEGEWVELFVRLRRYVSSRAKRTDSARIQEGKTLLAPLLDVLVKMKAQSAARATRKRNASGQTTTTNE